MSARSTSTRLSNSTILFSVLPFECNQWIGQCQTSVSGNVSLFHRGACLPPTYRFVTSLDYLYVNHRRPAILLELVTSAIPTLSPYVLVLLARII